MPTRTIVSGGKTWRVIPSGRVTSNDHDEFGLLFVAGVGDEREVRVTAWARGTTDVFHLGAPIDEHPESTAAPG